jgi:hypothetical protein
MIRILHYHRRPPILTPLHQRLNLRLAKARTKQKQNPTMGSLFRELEILRKGKYDMKMGFVNELKLIAMF